MRALSQGTAWRHTERGGRVTFKRSGEEEGGARACACVHADNENSTRAHDLYSYVDRQTRAAK